MNKKTFQTKLKAVKQALRKDLQREGQSEDDIKRAEQSVEKMVMDKCAGNPEYIVELEPTEGGIILKVEQNDETKDAVEKTNSEIGNLLESRITDFLNKDDTGRGAEFINNIKGEFDTVSDKMNRALDAVEDLLKALESVPCPDMTYALSEWKAKVLEDMLAEVSRRKGSLDELLQKARIQAEGGLSDED